MTVAYLAFLDVLGPPLSQSFGLIDNDPSLKREFLRFP